MELYARLRCRLRLLVRSEHGMALPTALFATIASMGLAGAAVMSSVDMQHGTKRDSDSKSAIAAADAGAGVALLRMNRYANALTPANPCLGMSGSTLVVTSAAADGWCPEVKGTVGGSTYAYRSTPLSGSTMTVVATGSDGSVSRRIEIGFKTTTVGSVFSSAGVIGEDWVTFDNGSETSPGVGVGTNGDVKLENSSIICGDIREGVGNGPPDFKNSSGQCSGYSQTEGEVTLPSVSTFIPTDIATINSNARLVSCTSTIPEKLPPECGEDTYSSSSKSPWDATKREIVVGNSSILTLSGGDYFICRLALVNSSELIISSKAQVRIFFDAPENCPGVSTTQLEVGNSSTIKATGYDPKKELLNMPGFYFLGSETIPTYVDFVNSSSGNELVIYGPNTDVVFKNSGTFEGAVAGKTVYLYNSTRIRQEKGFTPPQIGGATIYQRQSYVECVGPVGSPPDANC
jgi:hypothetical protein